MTALFAVFLAVFAVARPARGNLFKGPFHIPRMMTKSIELQKG